MISGGLEKATTYANIEEFFILKIYKHFLKNFKKSMRAKNPISI